MTARKPKESAAKKEPARGKQKRIHGLLGTYFNRKDLAGPVARRIDQQVCFDWRMSSPVPGVVPGDFSARWVGFVVPPQTGVYVMTVDYDDGGRLWVGTEQVIEGWDGGPREFSSRPVHLRAGTAVPLKLEYFDNGGDARLRLLWTVPGSSGPVPVPRECLLPPDNWANLPGPRVSWSREDHGLLATYFKGQHLKTPVASRIDPQVFFDWRGGSPVPGVVPNDMFSARWDAFLTPPASGAYIFRAESDDGIRIWLDGVPLLEEWASGSRTVTSPARELHAGRRYAIRIEYWEDRGGARLRIFWSGPNLPGFVPIPTGCLLAPTGGRR